MAYKKKQGSVVKLEEILPGKIDKMIEYFDQEIGRSREELLNELEIGSFEDLSENEVIYLTRKYRLNPFFLYSERQDVVCFEK